MSAKLIAFYKRNRLTIAYLLMTIVLAAPYIDIVFPTLAIREKLLSAIPLFLLFLFNDWRTESDDRLKRIEHGMNDPAPPTFPRFTAMEESMTSVMNDLIAKGDKISIKVIGVSSKFSSPFIQRLIIDLLETGPSRSLDVEIGIALTEPSKLKEWGLEEWDRSSRHCIEEATEFLRKHKKKMTTAGIKLTLGEYDNLPHWHGVMFNDKILFMGRTEWYRDGDDSLWQLRVGEVEYRRFEVNDSYGGNDRIDRFVQWHQRYLNRARDNKKIHHIDGQIGPSPDGDPTSNAA